MDKKSLAVEILKYWYFVEFMSQEDFPYQDKYEVEECNKAKKGEPSKKQIGVFETLGPNALYCESGNQSVQNPIMEAINRHNKIYGNFPVMSDEIELCIGKIAREVFTERLETLFGKKRNAPEKKHKSVGVIGLKCDRDGVYVPGSLNISPLVWGTHRLIKHHDASDYTAFLSPEEYHTEMKRLEAPLLNGENNGGKQLVGKQINLLIGTIYQKYLRDILDEVNLPIWDGVLIYQRYATEETKAEDNERYSASVLSHSFFSGDLLMVSHAVSNEAFGSSVMQEALLNYICGPYAEAHPELEWYNTTERIDILNWKGTNVSDQTDFLCNCFNVTNAPLGKWPSRFRPALMQQLAINSSWAPLAENQPIFSVNGPPGTGKTTLLKEIIAGNVVERAYRLAQYTSPDDAFEKKFFLDGDKPQNGYSKGYNAYYRFKDDELKNYGILVASCNNSAVENISKELPDGTELCEGLQPDKKTHPDIKAGLNEVVKLFQTDLAETIAYKVWNKEDNKYESRESPDIFFTKLANNLATSLEKRQSKEASLVEDRWGLISAPLGKQPNIKCYTSSVLKPYVNSFVTNDFVESKAKGYSLAAARFMRQYHKVKELETAIQRFSDARVTFLNKQEECTRRINLAEEEIKTLEEVTLKLQKEIQQLCKTIDAAERELVCNQDEADILYGEKQKGIEKQRAVSNEIESIHQKIISMERSRRFWDYVLEFLRRPSLLSRDIRVQYDFLEKANMELQKQIEVTERVSQRYVDQQNLCEKQEQQLSQWRTDCGGLMRERQCRLEQQQAWLEKIQKCHQEITTALSDYESTLREAASAEPANRMEVIDDDFIASFNGDCEEEMCKVHISNPWMTAQYDREREKLFFEALRLHKAFLLGSKGCLWNLRNLLLFWGEPGDDKKRVAISDRDRKAAFGDLLNTVFLLTPVLSTTFASVETLLKDIDKPGEIGCLIIDEAGQVAPQMAIGALYRSRRAIVVGDPKQVEPVVTDEVDIIKRIVRNNHTQYYQDKTLSTQGFADYLNRIGTYYTDGTQALWVGCPLVVHRRCISPMFDISNAISYDHIMKKQTKLPDVIKETTFCRENSGWINVCGSENNTTAKDHYVQTQGEKAWKLITTAFEKANGIPSLFVITPFISVRKGFRKFIKQQPEYKNDPRIKEWVENCVGTVHTFQGKEADQVIFLLGCDKNAVSAVKWVNTNMVNVAVTRAKFRLYVIGDYLVWKESEVFRKVKGILDSYAIRALHEMVNGGTISVNREKAEYLLKQLPDVDSLTIDGEPDDQLLSPLSNQLAQLLEEKKLTSKQLDAFNLSKEDIALLPHDIQERLSESILQHSILTEIKSQFQIEMSDASGTGVLFCKLMETMVKKQFLEKFKTYFAELDSCKNALARPCNKVTIGIFTNILREESIRQILASKGAVLFGNLCDIAWWDNYASQLTDFKAFRNACCHSEPFSWEQYEQMLKVLFEQREFMNTLVGDAL